MYVTVDMETMFCRGY